MLPLRFIREHADEIRATIRKKDAALESQLDGLLRTDEEWRRDKKVADDLRRERNTLSEAINQAKKTGGDVASIIAKAKAIPSQIKELEERELEQEKAMEAFRRKIPNIMHPDVPKGEGEKDNPTVKSWGKPKHFAFPVKNHVELAEGLGVADFEASAKTTGKGFYFLKGDLALLNQALVRFATDFMVKQGFTYVEPPLMVRRHVLDAAMDTTAFDQSIYRIVSTDENDQADPLCLIGTAEHAILGMLEGQTLPEERLPLKVFGYSMCFRQEIGSHGVNEKGLWRTHQFNKVEQFIFCTPEQTWAAYDELYKNSEAILQALNLPYRIIELCTGDLAMWKARSHDFEVWRPTTQGYGEVMSLSNCTVFQAADLDIRYVKKDGERGMLHTLNDTALATSRIMVAILENYQEADGSVVVPTVLRPYMGNKEKIAPLK